MKNINFLMLIIICTCLTYMSNAQEYKHNLDGINKIKISLSGVSDVKLIASNSNELIINSFKYENDEDNHNGLKAIYPSGTDNTEIGLSIEKKNDVLVISKLNPLKDDDYEFTMPSHIAIDINGMLGGDVEILGFDSEIEVKTLAGDIEIKDVTGPILANTTTGDIDISFSSVKQESPMSLVALTGDIEIKIPADTKANFVMETMTGTSYSDLEIKVTKDSKTEEEKSEIKKIEDNHHFGANIKESLLNLHNKIKATLNGGGVEILMKSLSGDIIIKSRKTD